MPDQNADDDVKTSRLKRAYNASVGFFKGSKVFNWVKGKI